MIQTASQFFKDKSGFHLTFEDMLVEFAKLHVEAALKSATDKGRVYYHSRDFKVGQKSEIVRMPKMVCELDKESILTSYPLTNIK